MSNKRLVAILLAFFLGGFGIHKFYQRKITLGIIYLLFSWTLIPGFIALIEFIIYLIMSDEEYESKFNSKK
jgi:TM2 domain-containing membrane protein YozV